MITGHCLDDPYIIALFVFVSAAFLLIGVGFGYYHGKDDL